MSTPEQRAEWRKDCTDLLVWMTPVDKTDTLYNLIPRIPELLDEIEAAEKRIEELLGTGHVLADGLVFHDNVLDTEARL